MAVSYKQAILDNGLLISAEVDPEAHTTACGYFVRTGTRDEEAVDMGVSHYLEHMMFKGTEKRSAEEVNLAFDDLGASNNAFTTQEITAFHFHSLPDVFPQALDILTDIMRPSLRENDFNDERGVILEEIAMYEDQPFWRLYEKTMEVHYGGHPLSRRVLGTVETVGQLQPKRMKAYFGKRYSADNTTLAIAGNVDFAAVTKQVTNLCSGWERTNTQRRYPELVVDNHEFTIDDERVARYYLVMISSGPSLQSEDRYAFSMLANLIGNTAGSLFHWALINPGMADEAQANYDGRDGVGDLFVYASCSPERAEQVEEIIDDQLNRCLELIKDDDLERLRNKTATAVTVGSEIPAGRMMRLGHMAMYYGPDEYRTLDEELARIYAVTLDDLRRVYEAYPFTPRTIGRLRPSANSDDDED